MPSCATLTLWRFRGEAFPHEGHPVPAPRGRLHRARVGRHCFAAFVLRLQLLSLQYPLQFTILGKLPALIQADRRDGGGLSGHNTGHSNPPNLMGRRRFASLKLYLVAFA